MMRSTSTALCICLCSIIALATSSQLYWVNNSFSSAGGGLFIVSYDTDTKQQQSYPIAGQTQDISKGSAVICQGIYYAYWYSPYGHGFLTFDVTEKKLLSYFTDTSSYGLGDYLALGCTETSGYLLLVQTQWVEPAGFLNYELCSAKFSKDSMEKEIIAYLPIFGSSIYSFNPDSSELWVNAMDSSDTHGQFLIFDTATGKLKDTYSYPSSVGWPYFTIPSSLSKALQGETFKGAVKSAVNTTTADYVEFKMSGNTLAANVLVSNVGYLYGEGLPITVCNDTAYVINHGLAGDQLFSFDVESGKSDGAAALFTNQNIGSTACV